MNVLRLISQLIGIETLRLTEQTNEITKQVLRIILKGDFGMENIQIRKLEFLRKLLEFELSFK